MLQIRDKKRQEKISGILGNNSSLGPAVHGGGKQSDTPFVGRPLLFDLGCSVRPAYLFRVHSPEAVTAGPWPRKHTSRPRPGTSFCLINFLSGSTPPKSAKRKRLPSSPRKSSRMRRTKKVRAEEELFFFFFFFSTSVLAVLGRCTKSIFLFFSFPCPEGRFDFSSEPANRQFTMPRAPYNYPIDPGRHEKLVLTTDCVY